MSDRLEKLKNENLVLKQLAIYTSRDLEDLFFEYDRMSSSGRKTLDRLAKMYVLTETTDTPNSRNYVETFKSIFSKKEEGIDY
tara:strand:+ start:50 stop:298 length:249 start_codon:yes stop_codon:yes gene_type:complete